MDKKVFIDYVNRIQEYVNKEKAIDEALRALSPDFGGFSYGELLDDIVNLLKLCSGDRCDNLDYFIWEYDFGKSALADSVTEEDGTPIPFRTPEDVYNLIMSEQIDEKDDSITKYLTDEVEKYKKLYENEKDHSATLQKIIDKTLNDITDTTIPKEAKEIQKKTTTSGIDDDFVDKFLDALTNGLMEEFK